MRYLIMEIAHKNLTNYKVYDEYRKLKIHQIKRVLL